VNVGKSLGKLKPRWRVTQEALTAFETARSVVAPKTDSPKRRRRNKSSDFVERY
jgi:hypothetical protein